MINFQANFATLCGLGFLLLSLAFPFIALTRRPATGERVIQVLALSPLYFFAGVMLVFYGWQFNLILQFLQILLFAANLFWVVRFSR